MVQVRLGRPLRIAGLEEPRVWHDVLQAFQVLSELLRPACDKP